MPLQDLCTYHIQLRGQIDLAELNALGPLQTTLEPGPPDRPVTCFTVRTDQAGIVGLLRHLHGMGIVFLEIRRGDAISEDPN